MADIGGKDEVLQSVAEDLAPLYLRLAPQIVGAARREKVSKSNRHHSKKTEPVPFTVAEFAKAAFVSVEIVVEEIGEGKIQADTSGKHPRIPFAELRRYWQARLENVFENVADRQFSFPDFAVATGRTFEDVVQKVLKGKIKTVKNGDEYFIPFAEFRRLMQAALRDVVRSEKSIRGAIADGVKYKMLEEAGVDERGIMQFKRIDYSGVEKA